MALQPIDLQTIFTQLDKVGKSQAAQREGMQIQAEIHAVQSQLKTEEQVHSVNEVQNTGDGVEKVNDRGARHERGKKGDKAEESSEDDSGDDEVSRFIQDPDLGRNIDFSG